jgi:hypothetical protein
MTFRERYSPDIPFVPYLTFPIKDDFRLTEGYIYSIEERNLHGAFWHRALDFDTRYGVPVYASASGFAVAGYHRFVLRNSDKTIRMFDGKPMANGFGYMVQIWHPPEVCKVDGGRITQYGHLSKVANRIGVKVTEPKSINHIAKILRKQRLKRNSDERVYQLERKLKETENVIKRFPWVTRQYGYSFTNDIETKESYLYTPEELKYLYERKSPFVRWVNQGEYIGNVGISAVFAGNPNYQEGAPSPDIREPNNSWDGFHLHFEETARSPETGIKHMHRDPFDIYRSFIGYKAANIERSLFVDNPF